MRKVDLFCLVADANMEAAISALLSRPKSLGTRQLTHRIARHPERDPGCFHTGPEFLRRFRTQADHALVILDFAWEGAPAEDGVIMERKLEDRLRRAGMEDWAKAVVIEPELEAWVFSDSPHVTRILGRNTGSGLHSALRSQGFSLDAQDKPVDPKAAMDWCLRQSRVPRSSSLYRSLAQQVGTTSCTDRAFTRFRGLLRQWFPPA